MSGFFSGDAFVHEVTHGPEGFDVSTTHTVTGYEVHAVDVAYTRLEHHVKREHEEAIRARVRDDLGFRVEDVEVAYLQNRGPGMLRATHLPTGLVVVGDEMGFRALDALLEQLVEALWDAREA